MSSDHDPGRSPSDADRAAGARPTGAELVPSPTADLPATDLADAADMATRAGTGEPEGADTDPYAALCDTLTRVVVSGPRWRRWSAVATAAAQSWWARGHAAAARAGHLRHRRLAITALAGLAAVALGLAGLAVTVQENWTPARIDAALRPDAAPGGDEDPRAGAGQPSAAPEAGDRQVAEDADPTERSEDHRDGTPADTLTVEISSIRRIGTGGRSDDEDGRRRERERSDDEPEAAGGSTPAMDSQPVPEQEPPQVEPASAPAPVTAPATVKSNLNPGERLGSEDLLQSANRRFALVMQHDGNLVLYRVGDRAIWSSRTHGNTGAYLVNQRDGNIVVYNARGPLWSTRTSGRSGAILVMQDDGNAVVYAGGRAVWSSGTAQ